MDKHNQLGSWGFIGEICDLLKRLTNYCTCNKWVFSSSYELLKLKMSPEFWQKNRKRKSYWPSNRDVVFLVDEIPLYQQQVFLHRKLKEIKMQLIAILQRLIWAAETANKWKKKRAKLLFCWSIPLHFFKVRTSSDKQNLRAFQGLRFI